MELLFFAPYPLVWVVILLGLLLMGALFVVSAGAWIWIIWSFVGSVILELQIKRSRQDRISASAKTASKENSNASHRGKEARHVPLAYR